jgi:membrane protease YdiL (CAAX protease family)
MEATPDQLQPTIQASPSAQDQASPSAQDQLPPSAQDQLPPSAQDQDPAKSRVFFGIFGLRAGWSLLIYLGIIALFISAGFGIAHQIKVQREHAAAITAARTGKPAPALAPVAPKPDASKPAPLSAIIISEAVLFGVFFLLSWLMSAIEHRKLSAFGLGGTHSVGRFLIGAVWGILAISLLIGTLRGFHFLAFDAVLDHGPSILFWGAVQLFAFFLVGLTEEYTMRGYLQFTLTRGMVSIGNRISPRHARTIAFWIASVFTSALFLFAHTHNAGENWLGLFQVFLAGILFVVALWRTGSLWWGIGFHMAWDWGQSFLYGVPDSGGLMQGRLFSTHAIGNKLYSGGTVGPEGSVLCIPIFLLVILVLLLTHPSPQPPLELPDTPSPQPADAAIFTDNSAVIA